MQATGQIRATWPSLKQTVRQQAVIGLMLGTGLSGEHVWQAQLLLGMAPGCHSCCWLWHEQQCWPLQLLLELAQIDCQHLNAMHHAAPLSTQLSSCMLTCMCHSYVGHTCLQPAASCVSTLPMATSGILLPSAHLCSLLLSRECFVCPTSFWLHVLW